MSAALARLRFGAWSIATAALFTGLTVIGVGAVAAFSRGDRISPTTIVLGLAAVIAGWLVAGEKGGLSVSGSFIVFVLAGAFLGPRSAILAAVISELTAAVRMRTRMRTVVIANLPPSVIPAAVSALLISALAPAGRRGFVFDITVGVGALTAITLSFVIFSALRRLTFPDAVQFGLRTFFGDLPNIALNVGLVVAGAALTVKTGTAGIAFALSAVLTFSYMARLLDQARRRSQQYVALSWGVLGGLIRSLDIRDQRASRHAAAVAAFARDIARASGMSEAECELAHTAGLLHDIGRFALSDRVAERGRELTEEDWTAIHRHPELGADLLKDLGMYGPVAEIVLTHHERLDGRGYPAGLGGDLIPEIAKVIAVAEVYDTLTAGDTYRTRMSSFEAIRELRRVSGTQLETRYVEALTTLLSGEGIAYRHADDASLDEELAIERRLG
ncbi:MAG: HD-GYP domain-containing protein [Solirubrobacteraceae bacterium]